MVIKALILFRGFCVKRPAPGTPSRVPSGTDPLRKKARDLRLCRIAPNLLPLTVCPVDSHLSCQSAESALDCRILVSAADLTTPLSLGLSVSGRVSVGPAGRSVSRSGLSVSVSVGPAGRSVARSVRLGLSGSGGAVCRSVCPSRVGSLWVRRAVVWPVWSVCLRLSQGWNSQFCFWSQRIYNGGRICYISYVFMVPY